MFRLLAKLYIQRSLDYQLPLPVWVQRRLKWDRELARYRQELLGIEEKLKRNAPAWLCSNNQAERPNIGNAVKLATHSQSNPGTRFVESHSGRYRVTIAFASLAALAILAFIWFATSLENNVIDPKHQMVHSSDGSLSVKSQDERVVKLAVSSAERFVHQVHLLGLDQRDNALAASNFLARLQSDLPLDQLNSKSMVGLRNCAQTAGRTTGQFFNQVGSSFRGSESDISDRLGSSVNSLRQSLSGLTQSLSKSILQSP